MTDDLTFDDLSLCGSKFWAARRLGRSKGWLDTNRQKLEQAGFPDIDPLTGLYIKADVDAWIQKRRQIAERTVEREAKSQGPRLNGL